MKHYQTYSIIPGEDASPETLADMAARYGVSVDTARAALLSFLDKGGPVSACHVGLRLILSNMTGTADKENYTPQELAALLGVRCEDVVSIVQGADAAGKFSPQFMEALLDAAREKRSNNKEEGPRP